MVVGTFGQEPCDKNLMIQAIHLKQGIIERAAKHMGITPRTIYSWIDKDEDVANALKEAREANRRKRADDKEDILISLYESYKDLVRGRDVTATIFGLKCLDRWNDKSVDDEQSTTKIETVDYSKAANG